MIDDLQYLCRRLAGDPMMVCAPAMLCCADLAWGWRVKLELREAHRADVLYPIGVLRGAPRAFFRFYRYPTLLATTAIALVGSM